MKIKYNMDTITKYFFMSVSYLFLYFLPAAQVIAMISFFVAADTITGITASMKKGRKITSKRFRDVIYKIIVYVIAILVSHVLQTRFFPDFPAMKIVAGLVAYSELISIDENIHEITGKSLFKSLIKKLK